jgi:glutamyl-tRNA reductase
MAKDGGPTVRGQDTKTGGQASMMLVAITHRHAPLELLEQVAVDAETSAAVGVGLCAHPGVSEAVVLSTCNRTEVYLTGPGLDSDLVLRALAEASPASENQLRSAQLVANGEAAAAHLFEVAAGLDSRVLGEAEVLVQVRAAIAQAVAAGSAGSFLPGVFRFAISTGRRAQRTTDHALIPSLSRLALNAARPDQVVGGPTVVLGSGAMAASTAQELSRRRLDYLVCARREELAAKLAPSAEHVIPFDQISAALVRAEVVICATGARSPLVRVPLLSQVMEERGGIDLTIVDLSLPRNIEPAAADLPGVKLLNLDDLVVGTTADHVRQRREIVADERRRYRSWLAGQAAGPLVAHLRDHVLRRCQAAIDRSADGIATSPAVTHEAARRMANKLLHEPIVAIKRLIEAGDHHAALGVLASHGCQPVSTPGFLRPIETKEGL